LLPGRVLEFERMSKTRVEATMIENYVASARREELELPSGMSLTRIRIGSLLVTF
jgi:hypothetical protein